MPTQLEIAYIAGIFDGEGSVDYAKRLAAKRSDRPKRYMCLRVDCTVSMTDEELIRWMHETLKLGTVRLNIKNKSPSSKPHWKDQWRWRCYHRSALKFAKLIIPFARVKRKKLQQIINHYELKQTQKNDKLSLRHTNDSDVHIHNAVSGDGNNLLK